MGMLSLKNSCILPNSHISKLYIPKSEIVILRGKVCDFPLSKLSHNSFILQTEEITFNNKRYKISGKVKVIDFLKIETEYGEELILKGKISKPYPKSYRDYLRQKGTYLILIVGKNGFIKKLGEGPNFFKYFAYKIRNKGINLLFKSLPFAQAAIFSAMLLGERSYIPPYFNRLFIQTGTIHILAVSGLHVGIVALILNIFLKVIGFKKRLRYALIIFLLIFYCLLTGSRPPVVRATIMAIVLLIGFLLKRKVLISHSLSIACLFILILNPSEIFDISFQLSFLSVISIVYLTPIIRKLFDTAKIASRQLFTGGGILPEIRRWTGKSRRDAKNLTSKKFCAFAAILRFSGKAFSISLSCWLGILPFILYYFRIISPITVFANILIVPYLGIVISLGTLFLSFAFILPVISPIFAQTANLSIIFLIKIIELFNKIPFGYFYLK